MDHITHIGPFDRMMSFAEAADLWGIDQSTLRKAVQIGKLTPGYDCRKFGKQWVITVDAMAKLYPELGETPWETHNHHKDEELKQIGKELDEIIQYREEKKKNPDIVKDWDKWYTVYYWIKRDRHEILKEMTVKAQTGKDACKLVKEQVRAETGRNAFRPTTAVPNRKELEALRKNPYYIINITIP